MGGPQYYLSLSLSLSLSIYIYIYIYIYICVCVCLSFCDWYNIRFLLYHFCIIPWLIRENYRSISNKNVIYTENLSFRIRDVSFRGWYDRPIIPVSFTQHSMIDTGNISLSIIYISFRDWYEEPIILPWLIREALQNKYLWFIFAKERESTITTTTEASFPLPIFIFLLWSYDLNSTTTVILQE